MGIKFCGECHAPHASDGVRAMGLFDRHGETRYRAQFPAAPVRASREEAIKDLCAYQKERHVSRTQ